MGDDSDGKLPLPAPITPAPLPPASAAGVATAAQGPVGGNALAALSLQDADARKAAYADLVHRAFIVTCSGHDDAHKLVEEIENGAAQTAMSYPDLQQLESRADQLVLLSSGDWDVASIVRLEIAVAGLPSELSEEGGGSLSTDLFIKRWSSGIADYLAAPDDRVQEKFSNLGDALNADAARFGSVSGILWGELTDAMNELVELRGKLHDFTDVEGLKPEENQARRRELGARANIVARHVLLLDQALRDPALVGIQLDPRAPLERQLEPVHTRIRTILTAEQTEEKTQTMLGPSSQLLAARSVGLRMTVEPEEAFPKTTDTAAEKWIADLAARAASLRDQVKAARAAVVPDQPPTTFDEFTQVYDRWFTFLPSRAIRFDPYVQEAVANWRELSSGLVGLGFEGWMANQLLKPVGYFDYASFAIPQEWSPLAPVHEREQTSQALVPDYTSVGEITPEYGLIESPAEAREDALSSGIDTAHQQFGTLRAAQGGGDVSTLAQQMGLIPQRAPIIGLSEPSTEDWNALVYYESPLDDTYKVYEHKTMGRPLLEYQAASAQLQAMYDRKHRPTTPAGAPIGERAIRQGGIEAATGTSQSYYGLLPEGANPAVETAKRQLDSIKSELKQLTDWDALLRDLEDSMSRGLATNDSPVFRIAAALYVAWREHDLSNVILAYLNPWTLGEAVLEALAIQAMLKALEAAGPIGRLFSNVIGKIMEKSNGSSLGMVLAMISWLDDTWRTTTFDGVRAQAYFSVDVIDLLLKFIHQHAVGAIANKLGGKIRKWGDPERWAPKTTRDLTERFRDLFEPDQIKDVRDQAADAYERDRKSLGDDAPETKRDKALLDDLDGKPNEPQTLEPTPLAQRVDQAADAMRKAGAQPSDVQTASDKLRADAHEKVRAAAADEMAKLDPTQPPPPIEVVPREQLGDPKSQAKLVIENGKITKILVDENASPAAIREEVRHAQQERDPRFKALFERISLGKPYESYTGDEKLAAHKAAVELEIADKHTLVDQLRDSTNSADVDERVRALEDINNLRQRQLELAKLRARDLKADKLSPLLSEPAEVHAKRTKSTLVIQPSFSLGTLGEFRAMLEASNPNLFLTAGEIEDLYQGQRNEMSPNRVPPASAKYDAPAKKGATQDLPLKTSGKRADADLLISEDARKDIDKQLRKRDEARRARNDALAKKNEAEAKRQDQKVREASHQLGEQALDMWAKQRAWQESSRPSLFYQSDVSRSGDFDSVHTWTDPKGNVVYLVGEGKGAGATLGGKWVDDPAGGGGKIYAEQGSRAYFEYTATQMSQSRDPYVKKAGDTLLAALRTGIDPITKKPAKILYEQVQVPVSLEKPARGGADLRSTVQGVEVTPFKLEP